VQERGVCSTIRRKSGFEKVEFDEMKPFNLSSEIAVITGGGSGLGKAIAQCMIEAGARVVIVGRRREELEKSVAELGKQCSFFCHDVTAVDKASELAQRIKESIGTPTILVNNAGIHLKKPAIDTTEAEFQNVIQTHLFGSVALTRAVLPELIARRHGSILFITSMAAIFGIPNVIAYTAAKSALLGVVRALATEVSSHGVRINAIAPGWIETEMTRRAMDGDPKRKEKILSRTPMGSFGSPEDIGWAAVYLSSPAARFVTGQQLVVDGGVSIGF
jgi:NAD(P)-dependent dehydrogenase (short-subunit alcohol dehydrogenase family)